MLNSADATGIMVDVETLGTTAGSMVFAAGFLPFNENVIVNEEFIKKFGVGLRLHPEGMDLVRNKVDASTLMFWMKQPRSVRKFVYEDEIDGYTTFKCPRDFLCAIWWNFDKFKNVDMKLWAKPSHFDFPLIEGMLRNYEMTTPWDFRKVRCAKTTFANWDVDEKNYAEGLTVHYPIDDCAIQVRALQATMRKQRECILLSQPGTPSHELPGAFWKGE